MNEFEMIELFYLVDDFSKRFDQMCFHQHIEYKKLKFEKDPLEHP